MLATPVSSARICWVRRAIVTACSVGRPSVSSMELVCSDWVPPSTAERACRATRTMLLWGCCAVREQPAVCACVRSIQERGSLAPNRSRITFAQMRRAARNLAISSKKSEWALKKNESLGAKVSTSSPASTQACTYPIPSASVKASSWAAVDPASRMW